MLLTASTKQTLTQLLRKTTMIRYWLAWSKSNHTEPKETSILTKNIRLFYFLKTSGKPRISLYKKNLLFL